MFLHSCNSYILSHVCYPCCLLFKVPLEVVDVYPPRRHDPALSPDSHVVAVDEDDVDFDTGGKGRTARVRTDTVNAGCPPSSGADARFENVQGNITSPLGHRAAQLLAVQYCRCAGEHPGARVRVCVSQTRSPLQLLPQAFLL